MPLAVRDTFPLTHGQAVRILVEAEWTPAELEKLLGASPEELHSSVGPHLKTYWYLTDRTYPLPRHYNAVYGLGHHDDMVRLILRNFAATLRTESFDLVAEVASVHKFWTDQGLDPLTLERPR